MIDKKRISAFFSRKTARPVSFKEIAQRMDLSRPESRALKKILREMLRNGELILTRKGLYAPAEELNLIKGYFEAHKDGYGFIIPEKPGERDIFIPPGSSRGSMDGDRVVARIENVRRREGRIVRILERTHKTVVGRFEKSGPALFIKPKARHIPFDLYVAPADRRKAKEGDTVIAEILSYPTEKRPATARVVNIIDKPDTPGADVEMIIDEFNLPKRFPKKVKEEAKLLYGQAGKTVRRLKRRDLRKLATVTIDGENAKDFDDAISISLTEHGYRLWVHIADVGYYVRWNTLMDLEARKRGTSVYFPDRVISMLPKELSEDLCSLRPKVERPAFTVEMDFNRIGKLLSANFYPSLITSDERMTYTSARKILVDQDRDERKKYSYLLKEFDLMADLCSILRSNRLERGSLDFDLPEPEVLLDLQGNPEAIVRAERNLAHMIIEEFMIAANEAVAEYMEQSRLPTLYRIHEEPDPMKLEDVFRVVRHFGTFRQKQLRPGDFSAVLKSIKGTAEEEIIDYIILRSLKQARYSTVNVGHFGLASKCYAHFTSPIRRYPDLIVHRILREKIEKKDLSDRRIKALEKLLPDIAFKSSQTERGADKAEREVIDTMKVWFMKDRLGEEFDAKIVGITPFGLKVRLKEFYVEGFLRVSSLTDDFYEYNDKNMRLNGRHTKRSFRIGQELKLRIDRVDMEEREVVFGI
jgi:ribonuclease R